jgi:hypothetical protein
VTRPPTGRPTGRPASTEHGEYGFARRNRCKCEKCREIVATYQKRYNLDRARGTRRRVPAAPARRHVQALLDAGYTPPQIYKAGGFVNTVFDSLMVGTRGRPPAEVIERATAVKIMSITAENLGQVPVLMDSCGLRRRYQALAYMGHSPATISGALGISVSCLYQYMRSERSFTRTVEQMHEVYVDLRDQTGDSGFNRWRAYREGWAPPFAWDDEDIDRPDAVPAGSSCVVNGCSRGAVKRNLCAPHNERVPTEDPRRYRQAVIRIGSKRVADPGRLRAELGDLKAAGYSAEQAAIRLSAGRTYVEKIWGRL